MKLLRYPLIILFTLILFQSRAEGDPPAPRVSVSGHVKDATTGEDLIGATVYVKETAAGTVTNVYGFYAISLVPGNYTIRYSYVGYISIEKTVIADKDFHLDIELEPASETLGEVEITAQRSDENVRAAEMSVAKMDVQVIQKIPALMGEVDIIKAIQLLPGVQSVSEGSSGFSVRGGNPDQNLILLDEATVYNPSHFIGFFSVFNNDAIKDVTLYKGDIPAQYGGRLSSVLDVRMKDGNMKKFAGTGGIGLISSRLTLEGPIVKDKSSFLVSGRRTYADLFLLFAKEEALKNSKLYFYDLNAKANYMIGENDRIYLSGYFGQDVFKNPFSAMKLGNATGTLRWNHVFSQNIFSNATLIYSHYNYSLGTSADEPTGFEWTSNLDDIQFKADMTWYPHPNHTLRFGLNSIYHTFNPGVAKGIGDETIFTEYALPKTHGLESGIYVSNEHKMGSRLTLKYGLRLSLYQNVGPATVYSYDQNFQLADSTVYGEGDFYKTYAGLEPRFGMVFLLNEKSSVKASYSHVFQYLQLAQNSTAGTPLDIWFSASPNVKPQVADQVAVGYFRNFKQNLIEVSAEVYYKTIKNSIDFKDHAELLLNKYLEGELRFGDARSYGLELMVRMPEGKLNGWVSYTFSRTFREFPDINNGNPYPAPYDVPHDVSIVLNYDLGQRWSFSANWVYGTGKPVTFPTGRAVVEGAIVPIYSDRNAYRMPDYHRLDLSVTFRGKPSEKRFKGEWVLSVYNAYNRHNAWAINFVQDENDPYVTYAEKTYLFGIVPSVTYNFKF
jgi:hypothetical protein